MTSLISQSCGVAHWLCFPPFSFVSAVLGFRHTGKRLDQKYRSNGQQLIPDESPIGRLNCLQARHSARGLLDSRLFDAETGLEPNYLRSLMSWWL